MSMPTFRSAIQSAKQRCVRWAPTGALFIAATIVAVESAGHPNRLLAPPPAAAISAPVIAQSSPRPPIVLATAAAARAPEADSATPPRWEMANVANARVDKWVGRFKTSLKADFGASLQRMSGFAKMISEKLAAKQMPQELVYLAMIESEFKPTARSPVHALGLWQFMSATARMYGLNVGHSVDERTNPAKSTDAALSYLADLHQRFGSWYLAAAAYNAGEGTVARALRTVTGKATGSDADFYRISSHLPAETRDYVPKLIAAARIGKDPGSYGFTEPGG
jgi:membrane-bound lytic murein transglycosylase D